MKTLYLDLGMGAAGDMLTAALLELFDDPQNEVEKLNAIGIPGVRYTAEQTQKSGVTGTGVTVTVHGEEEGEHHHHDYDHEHHHEHHEHHHHSGLKDIEHIVSGHLDLPENVKKDVLAVFSSIAEAESRVHGVPVPEIHFHEVGTMDAVADVAAVCFLLHELSMDRVIASPVCTGSGQVKCAHGILPVPAPATALLLAGIPSYAGEIQSELCTPTGAALIRHFAASFERQPVMKVEKIGYGCGKKDFPAANLVRAILGESADETDDALLLACNIDDMTGEETGFAIEQILEAGALDAAAIPATMKKGRPGIILEVLCKPEEKEKIVKAVFQYTSTIGVREIPVQRYTLSRETEEVSTPFGAIRKKVSRGYGVTREKYEFGDLAKIAREQGAGIDKIRRQIEKQ
ncbi:MAG: nickel pincer cofactor biosynthesis protein LarC [Clostridia bacterium]|nr:nickel pincer cofactor biosynthesis protein LarC [Clostridia bacterium]